MDRFEITKAALGYLRLKTTRSVDSGVRNIPVHCPFHTDKTPSMYVQPYEGVFRCFSCKRGGSIEKLFREITGESLYKTLGIAFDEFSNFSFRKEDAELDYDNLHKDVAVTITGDIISYRASREAVGYLRRRGIGFEVADAMKFRLAPLAYMNGTRFENRLIIPIYEKGRMIGVEGRDITGLAKPKCLYPARSTVNTLYDLDALDTEQPLYIQEGLMDLALLRAYPEFKNSTSVFGAALTHRQLYLLRKFKTRIYIPDNDEAGEMTLDTLRKELPGTFVLRVPKEYNRVPGIKDTGDIITKAHSSIADLLKRKWLAKIHPLT